LTIIRFCGTVQRREERFMPSVTCPKCGKRQSASSAAMGMRLTCECGHTFTATTQTLAAEFPQEGLSTPIPERGTAPAQKRLEDPHKTFALIAAVGGLLLLAIGSFFMLGALAMDTTVESSQLTNGYRETERVQNQGLMHGRQVAVLASGTAIVSGTLILGFVSLRSAVFRSNRELYWAIERLGATMRTKRDNQ
jgi:hypothetical protein